MTDEQPTQPKRYWPDDPICELVYREVKSLAHHASDARSSLDEIYADYRKLTEEIKEKQEFYQKRRAKIEQMMAWLSIHDPRAAAELAPFLDLPPSFGV